MFTEGVNKKKIMYFEIAGALIIFGLAFVFHFLYEWSGQNYIAGIFSAVNESVWEHVKIIFFPYLLFSMVEIIFIQVNLKKFFIAKTVGLLSIIVMLIVVFYTYTGIIGHHIMIVDIITTFIYCAAAQLISYKIMTSDRQPKFFFVWIVVFLAMITALFTFTVNPPQIPLFYDTQDNFYGMPK